MRRLWPLMLCLVLARGAARGAEGAALTCYLQFVCASDQETPPAPNAKTIGPELRQRLNAVFKWKHYWELKRQPVHLQPGGKIHVTLNSEREVELDWVSAGTMAVQVYYRGRLSRSSEVPVAKCFSVAGGDASDGRSWFVVIRRDKPPDD